MCFSQVLWDLSVMAAFRLHFAQCENQFISVRVCVRAAAQCPSEALPLHSLLFPLKLDALTTVCMAFLASSTTCSIFSKTEASSHSQVVPQCAPPQAGLIIIIIINSWERYWGRQPMLQNGTGSFRNTESENASRFISFVMFYFLHVWLRLQVSLTHWTCSTVCFVSLGIAQIWQQPGLHPMQETPPTETTNSH